MGLTKTQSGGLADDAKTTINNQGDNRVITGDASANTLNAESDVVINNGKLGVGVASPSQLIEVNGASNPAVLVKDTTNDCISYMYSQDSVATFGSASNHPVVFNVNNGEKVRINSSGNVGIGTTSPSQKLHLKDTAPMAQIESSSYSSFVGTAEANDNIGNGTKAGNLVLRGQTGIAISGNGGTATQVKIDADGLKFGTDTAAANALDDYEEGNWSPTDLGGSAYNVAGGAVGKYVKIGRVVHAWAQFGTTTSGNVAVGNRILIGDLPFNVNTVNNPAANVQINYQSTQYSTAAVVHVTSLNEIAFTISQTTGHPRSGAGYYVQVTYFTA